MTLDNKVVNQILAVEPTLNGTGIHQRSYEEDPFDELEIELCMEFLSQQKITKLPHRDGNSYTLKHAVEVWHRKKYGHHQYISNGSVIAAMILMGIKYKVLDNGPNVCGAVKLVKEKQVVNPYSYVDRNGKLVGGEDDK